MTRPTLRLILVLLPAVPLARPGTAAARVQDPGPAIAMRAARSGGPAVTGFTQDSAGFVWVGTHTGVERTDGLGFEAVSPAGEKTVVTAVLADRHGAVWWGSALGLARLDPATGTVTRYRHDPDDPGSLSSDRVHTLFEDGEGRLWVGALDWATESGGLNRFDPETGSFERFVHDPADPASLSHDRVRAVAQTPDGTVWVATWHGLNALDPQSGRFRRWLHDPDDPASLAYDDVADLEPTPDGRLWVATLGGGLDLFDPRTGVFVHHRARPGDETGLSSDFVMDVELDPVGRLWIGTLDRGLDVMDPTRGTIRSATAATGFDHGGRLERIDALALTRDDVLWVAGIHPLHQTSLVVTIDTRAPRIEVLDLDATVVAVAEQRPRVAWVLTVGGGLVRWDRRTGEIEEHRCGVPTRERPLDARGALLADTAGALWIGTAGAGLCRVAPGGEGVEPVVPATGDMPGTISSLAQGPEGSIWMGLSDGVGVLDPRSREVVRPSWARAGPTIVLRGREQADERFQWLADPTDRLLRWAPGDAEPVPVLDAPAGGENDRERLLLQGLAVDGAGGRWGVSPSRGLCRLDEGTVTCPGVEAGGWFLEAVGVWADRKGELWVSLRDRLVRFDPVTGDTRVLEPPWPPERRYFQPMAGALNAQGELYLGGGAGVVVFDTEGPAGNPHPPAVVITGWSARGGDPADGTATGPGAAEPDGARLAYDQNDLVVRYAGLHYAQPEGLRYAYRLVGYDDEFHDAGARREISYVNLPPGDYEFQVRATTAFGVESETPAALRFHVAAPWWVDPRAFALYLAAGLALLAWWVRVVQNRARLAARLELKSAEALRLKDLDDAKSRFFANISHEFRTPLTLILGQVRSVLDDPTRAGNDDRLRMAERSAERVGRMVDQILDLSKLEAGTMALDARVADLVPLVRLRVASFESLAEARGVALGLGVQRAPLPVRHDPEKMEMIVDNLLSNALKFTEAGGSVLVTLRAVDRPLDASPLVELEVADTGVGIAPEHLPHVFERFYQVGAGDGTEGAGIGLALTRELVHLHGGDIDAASRPGDGTRFVVRLPLASVEPGGGGPVTPPVGDGAAAVATDVPEAAEPDPDVAGRDDEERPATEADDPRPLILLVEDNADLRSFLRDHLGDDHRLLEAADGEAGLARALETIPDLVLTDVMMPRLDGYELARRLRADPRTSHVPIVMLTAKASDASRIQGLDLGVDDYLLKPFNREVLLTRIRSLIELRKLLREKYAGETWIRPEEVEVGDVDRSFLRQVTEAVEARLGDSAFGVEDLAAAVHMSSSQLTRKTRALVDQTPGRLIRGMRLHRAAELIRKNAGTLTRIAFLTGFSDQAHLSRSFKAHFGCTPSAYRDGAETEADVGR